MLVDSKTSLFKQISNNEISNLIKRSQFNKRRGKLFQISEEVRIKLAYRVIDFEDYFIVDSMPLEICEFSLHRRIKNCKDEF